MKYIDVTRTTHTSLDVLCEKQIDDDWNVDGKEDYQMHRLHKIHFFERKET